MIHREPALLDEAPDTVRKGVPQVPADRQQDHIRRKWEPREGRWSLTGVASGGGCVSSRHPHRPRAIRQRNGAQPSRFNPAPVGGEHAREPVVASPAGQ